MIKKEVLLQKKVCKLVISKQTFFNGFGVLHSNQNQRILFFGDQCVEYLFLCFEHDIY